MLARIGKYEIRDELGKGGFGQVYLGLDPTMDRLVAIKVLSAGGDSSLLIRFQTEATAAGNLNHKNIVTVYEFGEDRGMFFLAMEYLAGQDLQKAIDSAASRSVLDKMRIMTQVAEGLLCAHQGGVVHRDVKPANIMLLPDGTVKVMDFGIARLTRENSARLTQTGYLIGSVSHMAPEQFRGIEADVLCDIWAYGTIYYELLTGTNPFHAADAPSTMYKITNVDPDGVRKLCPECPEALERVLAGLLEKDRANRYQTLDDVLFETTPILLDLQKAEVTRLVSRARELLSEDKVDDANQVVRKILALDSMNAEGRALREQLQNEVKVRSTRGRIEALWQKAEKAIGERNYPEAIQALGSAVQINPKDTVLRQRLTELQEEQEQREKAARLLVQAKSELEQQKLTSAFQSATDALHAEPENPAAREMLARIEAIIAERDSQRRLKDGLTKVRGLLVVEALDEAIAALQELAKHAPDHPQVRELLARTHTQRDARDRQRRVNAGLETARDSIRAGDFAGAIATLEGLTKEFPDESSVAEMLAYAQDEFQSKERAAKIKAVGNQAWAALKAKEFDKALEYVEDGLAASPGNERLVRLQDVIISTRAEHQQADRIRKALEESTQHQAANRLDEALSVLDAALRGFPSDSELQKAREDVRRKMEDRERKRRADAIQDALTKARGMVEGGKADSATSLLASATLHYPNVPELASLLDWAKEEQKRQHEKTGINEILSRAEALEKEGSPARALEAIEAGLQTYPGSPELTGAAARLRTLVKLQQDLDAIRQPMARKDWATALTLLDSAMERHPDEAALNRLAEQARQEQRKAEIEGLLSQARRELDAQDLDSAKETVAGGLRNFPNHPKLIVLQTEATARLERRDNLERARQLGKNRDWASAEAILRKILERDPSDTEARALWEGVSKEREKEDRWRLRDEGREAAQRSLRQGRFEEAEARLRALLQEFPGDSALIEDLNRVLEAKQQRTRREVYLKGRQTAAASLKAQQFDAATAELRNLLQEFPGDAPLEEDLKTALAIQQDHQRREVCDRERRKASEFLAKREFDAAIRCLEALLAQFPGDVAIKEDLASAAGAKALFEQRQWLDHQVQELEKLYRKGDPDGVKQQIRRLGAGITDPRIRELNDWADTELAREVSREPAENIQNRRRRRKFVAIGVGAAVILSGFAIWIVKSFTSQSPGLALSSSEIVFHIAAGATETVSQTIQLNGGIASEAWSSSATDAWLSAAPQSGTTPASIVVSVDPAHLNPGSHTGTLAFTGRDTPSKRNLSVKVIIDRPQQQPEQKKVETTQGPLVGAKKTTAVKTTQPDIKTHMEQPITEPVVTPIVTPPIEKPKLLPIVDCHTTNYHGPSIGGTLKWLGGSLDPNGLLVLGDSLGNVAGGRVTGQALPGCDVSVSIDTSELELVEKPSQQNNFRQVKVRNKSGIPISNIEVQWKIK
jgi:eukaryotic-like serine/threonine-protein kinase